MRSINHSNFSPDAAAILAAAIVSAKQFPVISQSFAQVCWPGSHLPFGLSILPFGLSSLPFGLSILRAKSPVMHLLFPSSHWCKLQLCTTSYVDILWYAVPFSPSYTMSNNPVCQKFTCMLGSCSALALCMVVLKLCSAFALCVTYTP